MPKVMEGTAIDVNRNVCEPGFCFNGNSWRHVQRGIHVSRYQKPIVGLQRTEAFHASAKGESENYKTSLYLWRDLNAKRNGTYGQCRFQM